MTGPDAPLVRVQLNQMVNGWKTSNWRHRTVTRASKQASKQPAGYIAGTRQSEGGVNLIKSSRTLPRLWQPLVAELGPARVPCRDISDTEPDGPK